MFPPLHGSGSGPPPAKAIRAMRIKHALTAVAAGRLVHVTENAWRKWENGTRAMDLAHWELFLIKLGEHKPGKGGHHK